MIEQDDFIMAFMDSADQIPVLFIHGFPLDSTLWEFQFEELSGIARLIAPDLRGHGRSDAPPSPYSMKMFAADCAGLMSHLAIERPVVVCGLSMGGYVALEFYRQYPEMVAALILTATQATADDEAGKKKREETAVLIREQGITPVVEGMLPKMFSPHTFTQDENEIIPFVREMMMNTPPEGAIGALMAMKERMDSTPTLRKIQVPTLIIHGEDDQIIPLAKAQAMHEAIPHSELVIIEKAGHLLNMEQPEQFNEALFDFLDSLQLDEIEEDE